MTSPIITFTSFLLSLLLSFLAPCAIAKRTSGLCFLVCGRVKAVQLAQFIFLFFFLNQTSSVGHFFFLWSTWACEGSHYCVSGRKKEEKDCVHSSMSRIMNNPSFG